MKRLLLYFLIIQLTFPQPQLLLALPPPGDQTPTQNDVQNHTLDPFLLTKQVHRIYSVRPTPAAGTPAVEAPATSMPAYDTKDISLSQIQTQAEPITIYSFEKEIERPQYNPATKEILLERKILDLKTNQKTLTNAHIIGEVTLTTTSDHFIYDKTFILFSTPEGIRCLFRYQADENLFMAAIPVFLVVPAPKEGRITAMSFLSRAVPPQSFRTHRTYIQEGDLKVTVQLEDGSYYDEHILRTEIYNQLRERLYLFLLQLYITDPDPRLFSKLIDVAKANAHDEARLSLLRNQLLSSSHSELLEQALVNISRRVNVAGLVQIFEKNLLTHKDMIETLQDSPRDEFPSDPSDEAFWSSQYRLIAQAKTEDPESLKRPWRDVLKDALKKPSLTTIRTYEAEIKIEKSVAKKTWARVVRVAKEFGLPSKIIFLTAALTTDVLNHVTHGAIIRSFLKITSTLLGWTTDVWMIKDAALKVSGAASYLQEEWAVTRLIAGMCMILMFRPLSLYLAQAYSRYTAKDKEGPDKVKSFFKLGLIWYARLVRPFQKWLWEEWGKQRLVYAAIQNKVDPLKHRSVAFHSRSATKNQIEEKRNALIKTIMADANRHARAVLIAAAIVTVRTEFDPMTLISLIRSSKGKRMSEILNLTVQADRQVIWADLIALVYRGLEELSDQGVGDVDEAQVQEYVYLFKDIADEVRRGLAEPSSFTTTSLKHIREWIIWAKNSFNAFTSERLLPYFLFGKQGLAVYYRYKDARIDKDSANIANLQYEKDYDWSMYYYAATDSAKVSSVFSSLWLLRLESGAAEVSANQLGQVLIYYLQTGLDAISLGHETSPALINQYPPFSVNFFESERRREQSLRESLGILFRSAADPDTDSYFNAHAQFIRNNLAGLQVRYLAGVVVRFLGMWVEGDNPWKAFPKEASFLIGKYNYEIDSSGLHPGYATVWPFVSKSIRVLNAAAVETKVQIEYADYLLYSGIELKDEQRVQAGVEITKNLLIANGVELPVVFTKRTEEYTLTLASELLDFSVAHFHPPTKASERMKELLNIGPGALISTALFANISGILYDPKTPALETLGRTLFYLGGTWLLLRNLPKITPPILRFVREFVHGSVEECRYWLGGR